MILLFRSFQRLQVKPLGEMTIPQIELYPTNDINLDLDQLPPGCQRSSQACVHLYAHYGTLKISENLIAIQSKTEITYNNNDKKAITIKAKDLESLNMVLETVKYKSVFYEPKGATDIITIRYASHKETSS